MPESIPALLIIDTLKDTFRMTRILDKARAAVDEIGGSLQKAFAARR